MRNRILRGLLRRLAKWLSRSKGLAGIARKAELLIDTAPLVDLKAAAAGATATGNESWAAGDSDPGKVRENNEDSYLCDPLRGLFVIADGMGGHAAGEQASGLAIQVLDEVLSGPRLRSALEGKEGDMSALLTEALQEANDRIHARSKEVRQLSGMASTAVIGVMDRGVFHVVNIGDSRAYLVRGGEAGVLTRDHSVAAAMCEQGQLTATEARYHQLRNRLTASLGSPRAVTLDYKAVQVGHGDRIVLCSDGLWDMLPDVEIAGLVGAAPTPRMAVQALVRAANEAGGLDNITVIVVDVRGSEEMGDVGQSQDASREGNAPAPTPSQPAQPCADAVGLPVVCAPTCRSRTR
jgi:protein phosphatase